MIIQMHRTVTNYNHESDEWPDVELPDDAVVVGVQYGASWFVIHWYRHVLRPSKDPTR